jgi:hypothetical protein
MHTSRPSLLVGTILALLVAAGTVLVLGDLPRPGRQARAEEFQHLVGGLGFGPALDLSGCVDGFDPRLDPACSQDVGPIPGGVFLCPIHAGNLLSCPPPAEANPDGPLP